MTAVGSPAARVAGADDRRGRRDAATCWSPPTATPMPRVARAAAPPRADRQLHHRHRAARRRRSPRRSCRGGAWRSTPRHFLYYFRVDRRSASAVRRTRRVLRARRRTTTRRAAAILQPRHARGVSPGLPASAIDYAWGGNVAFTRDQMPHAGRLDGVVLRRRLLRPRHRDGDLPRASRSRAASAASPSITRCSTMRVPADPAVPRPPVVPAARRAPITG